MPEYGRTTGNLDGSWHVTMITHEDVPGGPAVPRAASPGRDPAAIAREALGLVRQLAREPGHRARILRRAAELASELDDHATGQL